MDSQRPPSRKTVGRAATVNPPIRFERLHVEEDLEQLEGQPESLPQRRAVATEFFIDRSRSLICENDSDDVPFRWSINPYRGCEHGCAYCYARPSHEMLGMNAGLDFETKILVKQDAATLLRRELNRPGWRGEMIALSGSTDCYQPAERRFRITRALLEVMVEARQSVAVITKNALVLRDMDLLRRLAENNLAQVNVSVTTLDAEFSRVLEPRTATPAARLRAITELSAAGVPVRVMVAPIIPGLNDHQLPEILRAAKEAGACTASYILLRLPWSVAPVFLDWLATHRPLARERVEGLIRLSHGGRLNDPRFGSRMSGEGAYAEGIRKTFEVFVHKLNLARNLPPLDSSLFRRPRGPDGQMRLF